MTPIESHFPSLADMGFFSRYVQRFLGESPTDYRG